MGKTINPAHSRSVSGSIGDLVYDYRGYVRSKPKKSDKPQSAARGNVQQSFAAARKTVKIAGPTIEQAIRTHKDIKRKKKRQRKYFQPGYWATYLASEMLGTKRGSFIYYRQQFDNLAPSDQLTWEKIGYVVGLERFEVAHASEAAITPGLQLYWLAKTLRPLGIYTHLAPPNAENALNWAAHITEVDIDIITEAVNNLTELPQPTPKPTKQKTQQPTSPQPTTTELVTPSPKQTTPTADPSPTIQPDPLGLVLLEQLNRLSPIVIYW